MSREEMREMDLMEASVLSQMRMSGYARVSCVSWQYRELARRLPNCKMKCVPFGAIIRMK